MNSAQYIQTFLFFISSITICKVSAESCVDKRPNWCENAYQKHYKKLENGCKKIGSKIRTNFCCQTCLDIINPTTKQILAYQARSRSSEQKMLTYFYEISETNSPLHTKNGTKMESTVVIKKLNEVNRPIKCGRSYGGIYGSDFLVYNDERKVLEIITDTCSEGSTCVDPNTGETNYDEWRCKGSHHECHFHIKMDKKDIAAMNYQLINFDGGLYKPFNLRGAMDPDFLVYVEKLGTVSLGIGNFHIVTPKSDWKYLTKSNNSLNRIPAAAHPRNDWYQPIVVGDLILAFGQGGDTDKVYKMDVGKVEDFEDAQSLEWELLTQLQQLNGYHSSPIHLHEIDRKIYINQDPYLIYDVDTGKITSQKKVIKSVRKHRGRVISPDGPICFNTKRRIQYIGSWGYDDHDWFSQCRQQTIKFYEKPLKSVCTKDKDLEFEGIINDKYGLGRYVNIYL